MIEEDYISFEIAKLLKEKGFNEPTLAYAYSNDMMNYYSKPRITDPLSIEAGKIPIPTLQMVMKWLREVYNLHITVHPGVSEYGFVWTYSIVFAKEAGKGETHFYKINQITTPIVKSKSCEKACEAAIKYCLENLI